MAQTKTKTKVDVVNWTRNELSEDTAKRFLDIASDNGTSCEFYYTRLNAMIKMELVKALHMVVSCEDEPLGGASLEFDWTKQTAMVRAHGEFIDPSIINKYGTTDSIIDTLEVVRKYISGLCKLKKPKIGRTKVWYTENVQKVNELGRARFDQLIDAPIFSPEAIQRSNQAWAEINAVKADKEKRRVSTFGDLPEASVIGW